MNSTVRLRPGDLNIDPMKPSGENSRTIRASEGCWEAKFFLELGIGARAGLQLQVIDAFGLHIHPEEAVIKAPLSFPPILNFLSTLFYRIFHI